MRLVIPGLPKAQGSLRSFTSAATGKVVTPQDKAVLSYRALIHEAWMREAGDPRPLHLAAFSLTLEFSFRRPDSHYKPETKTRGKREVLRDFAPIAHTKRPDGDKLLRSVMDALTDYAYADDAQVSSFCASKRWANDNMTVITIEEVDLER